MSCEPFPAGLWLEQLPASVVAVFNGSIRYANAAALSLLEADQPTDLLEQPVTRFLHPLDVSRALARGRRAEMNCITNPPTEFRLYTCKRKVIMVAITSTHIEHNGQNGVLITFLDMSHRAEMETRLRETENSFQRIMNTMQDVFYRTDAQGITRYVCPAVIKVLGYADEEIIGLPAAMFYPDPNERDTLIQAIRTHGFVHDFPGRMRHKDGKIIDISISTHALYDEQGLYAGVEGIWRDITERKRMERELQRLATRDDLTGIDNRRSTLEHLEFMLKRHQRTHIPFMVLLLDLDHFKRVNDTLGHAAGDQVLRQFVFIINEQKREIDHFGRLGGEEFLVIVDDASFEQARGIAERMRTSVQHAQFTLEQGMTLNLTISIGMALAQSSDRRAGDMLERADRALYQAKNAGRNRVMDWTDAIS